MATTGGNPTCPTTEELKRFVARDMTGDRRARIQRHLDGCAACRNRAERIDAERDAMLDELRHVYKAAGSDTRPQAGPTACAPEAQHRDKAGRGPAARNRTTSISIDGYDFLGTLGKGGQGVVFLARQTATRRKVAIKILPAEHAADDRAVSRFRREALAAAQLDHPNIVSVYASGQADGQPYIVYEYVEGKPLNELLSAGIPLHETQIVQVSLAVASALRLAHKKGVLHRDIKPENILVTEAGDVKLTDFGLARFDVTEASFRTSTGQILGTPQFVSPEQVRGEVVDRRSDIYSLGCVMYNMSTGTPPFVGDNPFVIMDQHRRVEPPGVKSINPQISDAFAGLVARAMAKIRDHRYSNMESLIEHLVLIRRALFAPENARGGIEQVMRALRQLHDAGSHIESAKEAAARPSLSAQLTAAFLKRPTTWIVVLGCVVVGAMGLGLLLGFYLGR